MKKILPPRRRVAEEGGSYTRSSRPPEPPKELDAITRKIIGSAIRVHRALGPGLLESVYENALCVEFAAAGIAHERQVPVELSYSGRVVGEFRLDLLVANLVIVEIKAVEQLAPIHQAQLLGYLRAANRPLGLLINFNSITLKSGVKRVIAGRGR